jgi:hypothetical protein
MRAMSVLANAKSNRHRKTHRVEPEGAGRMFRPLTRGDPRPERAGEVSRGRSSVEAPGNRGGAKGQRTKRGRSILPLRRERREDIRNGGGAATAAATLPGGPKGSGWNAGRSRGAGVESLGVRKEDEDDAQ